MNKEERDKWILMGKYFQPNVSVEEIRRIEKYNRQREFKEGKNAKKKMNKNNNTKELMIKRI